MSLHDISFMFIFHLFINLMLKNGFAPSHSAAEQTHNDIGDVHFNSLLGWTSKPDLAQNSRASGKKRSRSDD